MAHKSRPAYAQQWAFLACLIVLGGIGVGLVFNGCSDSGVVVVDDPSEDYVSFFDVPYYPDAVAKRTDITDATFEYVESRLLADEGGLIALGDNADIEAFVVLPASIPADTTFAVTVTKMVTADGEPVVVYEFGPDGLQFSRPAVIRLDLGVLFGKAAKGIDLYWLNEETHMWEYTRTCIADDQQIVYAPIEHFSSYVYKTSQSGTTADL